MDEDTLVVGKALDGHDFSEGVHRLRGRTCPWNTFAIWSLPKISLIGFPLVGDGVGNNTASGGVEVFIFT